MKTRNRKTDIGVRTWVEIDKRALRNNFEVFRTLLSPQTKLLAVVKSNAYGHDLVPFAKEAEKNKADWLGVDSPVEAFSLRQEGVKTPLLVLGMTLPSLLKDAVEDDVSITISNFPALTAVEKLKSPVNAHIKIDTGMRRQGFQGNEVPELLRRLLKAKNIKVEGLYTHFAAAKNPSFPADTFRQAAEFEKVYSLFHEKGFQPIRHASATAGTVLFPQFHYDMVRIGIGLYGEWPSQETRAAHFKRLALRPVLSWKSVVGEVKKIKKGEGIGYDLTENLPQGGKIAILPVGYWHGLPRALSSIGEVLIRGKRAKIVGRVSMDMIAVDVSDIHGVSFLDEAVLLGRQGNEMISTQDVAALCDTTAYEFLTRINSRIRRVFI